MKNERFFAHAKIMFFHDTHKIFLFFLAYIFTHLHNSEKNTIFAFQLARAGNKTRNIFVRRSVPVKGDIRGVTWEDTNRK